MPLSYDNYTGYKCYLKHFLSVCLEPLTLTTLLPCQSSFLRYPHDAIAIAIAAILIPPGDKWKLVYAAAAPFIPATRPSLAVAVATTHAMSVGEEEKRGGRASEGGRGGQIR